MLKAGLEPAPLYNQYPPCAGRPQVDPGTDLSIASMCTVSSPLDHSSECSLKSDGKVVLIKANWRRSLVGPESAVWRHEEYC